jgi:hypothetical protein
MYRIKTVIDVSIIIITILIVNTIVLIKPGSCMVSIQNYYKSDLLSNTIIRRCCYIPKTTTTTTTTTNVVLFQLCTSLSSRQEDNDDDDYDFDTDTDNSNDQYIKPNQKQQEQQQQQHEDHNKEQIVSETPIFPLLHYPHHTAIKTRNITLSIMFYNLFGYQVEYRFRTGPARAVWMIQQQQQQKSNSTTSICDPNHYYHHRLELIEVPSYMLQNNKDQPLLRGPNLMERPDILGLNHIAMDVTKQIEYEMIEWNQMNHTYYSNPSSLSTLVLPPPPPPPPQPSLSTWIQQLNETSIRLYQKSIRTALYPPQQQLIGIHIYEIAFIYDIDNTLIELLYQTSQQISNINITSGWEPWDSTTFQ